VDSCDAHERLTLAVDGGQQIGAASWNGWRAVRAAITPIALSA
jgi:hypothetical protein